MDPAAVDAYVAEAALRRVEELGPEGFGALLLDLSRRAENDPDLDEVLDELLSDEVGAEVIGKSVAELRAAWDDLSDAARYLIVRTVVEAVVVGPEGDTVADRVHIVWAGGAADAPAGVADEWTPGDLSAVLSNPFYAIDIDPGLAVPHEKVLSEEDWIRVNIRLIEQLGPEAYLRNLLSALRGNFPLGGD